MLASFVDGIGRTMIFPFFALYVTERFNVGMTEAGVLFAIFSVSGFGGSMLGGALTDKFGRRWMVLFGLAFSALSSLTMGIVNQLAVFYVLAIFVGSLSNIAGPARQAMVADMLPQEKVAEGFGILRVAGNLSWIIGPTIGGLVAATSYFMLFVLDAITSLITAGIVFKLVPETKPEATEQQKQESTFDTLLGYWIVVRDRLFMAFLFASMLMLIVYQQMYNTLSVYLRDVHGLSTRGYGLLLSLNAGTVVLLQFWVTRRVRGRPPMLMMALGTTLYLIGFSMYGFVATYWLFVAAMLLITFGEMIVIPVGQGLVAGFSPETMRGRYMAMFGLSWTIPAAIGPWAAGLILDNYNPNWVWYLAGIISAFAVIVFLMLHAMAKTRFADTAEGRAESLSTA